MLPDGTAPSVLIRRTHNRVPLHPLKHILYRQILLASNESTRVWCLGFVPTTSHYNVTSFISYLSLLTFVIQIYIRFLFNIDYTTYLFGLRVLLTDCDCSEFLMRIKRNVSIELVRIMTRQLNSLSATSLRASRTLSC